MPTLTAGSTILVTGGNGYIGSWVVQTLLSRGFIVRATVRSLTKAKPLQDFFEAFVKEGKLTFVVVEDLIKEGAFDEAIIGVDGILHLASPLPNPAFEDPEELIRPAVNGTLNVLKSAAPPQSTVKRIVFTSSVAAVDYPVEDGRTLFDESDWSIDPELVAKQGRKAHPMTKYRASKTLAEKAAWEFYDTHKESLGWDLACLNPPYVFGPLLYGGEKADAWTGTQAIWYNAVLSTAPRSREDLASSNSWVDVRDVAEAHVRALETEAAGGERIIVSQGPFIWQEWVDIVHSLDDKAAKGYPDLVANKVHPVVYGTTKEAKILGLKYRSKEETTKDNLKLLGKEV